MADYRVGRDKNGLTVMKDGKLFLTGLPTLHLARRAIDEEQKHEALIRIATDDALTLRKSLETNSGLTRAEVAEIFHRVLEEKI